MTSVPELTAARAAATVVKESTPNTPGWLPALPKSASTICVPGDREAQLGETYAATDGVAAVTRTVLCPLAPPLWKSLALAPPPRLTVWPSEALEKGTTAVPVLFWINVMKFGRAGIEPPPALTGTNVAAERLTT